MCAHMQAHKYKVCERVERYCKCSICSDPPGLNDTSLVAILSFLLCLQRTCRFSIALFIATSTATDAVDCLHRNPPKKLYCIKISEGSEG